MNLRKHASSLAIMHAAEVLQPLLILPYAGRVLGPLEFGHYAYAISIGQLAASLVAFGFHWTGQRTVAAVRNEPRAIASLLAEIITAQLVLCFLVTLAGLAASGGILALSHEMFLYAMLTAVGGVVFPIWLFIGLERAWQAAFAVVIARVLALVAFVVLVTSPDQIALAVATQSAIPLVSGLISIPFLIPIGFGGFRRMTIVSVALQFRGGWRVFLSMLVERVALTLQVPLVQHFAGYVDAGEFAVAEKFVSATRPFVRVIWETFLPRVAYYAHHDPGAGIALIWRSLRTVVVGAALSLGLFFVAPYVIVLLFGEEFRGAVPIVRIMAMIPLLLNINIVTSNLYMFNYGHERAWAALSVAGLAVFLATSYALVSLLPDPDFAVAIGMVGREGLILVVSVTFLLVHGAGKSAPATAENAGGRSGAVRMQPLNPVGAAAPAGADGLHSKS
jgi:O-antigen/teichoic acid export membrane protein